MYLWYMYEYDVSRYVDIMYSMKYLQCMSYVKQYNHDVTSQMIKHNERCAYLWKLVVATELLIKDTNGFPTHRSNHQ